MRIIIRMFYLVVLDVLLVSFSIGMAYLLKYDIVINEIYDNLLMNISRLVIISIIIKIIFLFIFKLYNSMWRYAGVRELISIIFPLLFGNICL